MGAPFEPAEFDLALANARLQAVRCATRKAFDGPVFSALGPVEPFCERALRGAKGVSAWVEAPVNRPSQAHDQVKRAIRRNARGRIGRSRKPPGYLEHAGVGAPVPTPGDRLKRGAYDPFVPRRPWKRRVTTAAASAPAAAGAAAAGLVPLAVGGPWGVVGGAAIGVAGVVLDKVVAGQMQRHLGEREQWRLMMTAEAAVGRIAELQAEGRTLRDDGFFADNLDGRSPASEVFEGLMKAAEQEHEELKLRHIGHMLAELGFRSDIGRAHANLLVHEASALTYRQVCLLAIAARQGWLLASDPPNVMTGSVPAEDARHVEALDLANRRLLGRPDNPPEGEEHRFWPRPTGTLLIDLLGLDDLTEDELRSVVGIDVQL